MTEEQEAPREIDALANRNKLSPGHFFASPYFSTLFLMFVVAWAVVEINKERSLRTFESQVAQFMNEGSRNTLVQGYDLCVRIARLEQEQGIEINQTCDEIYINRKRRGK